MVCFGDETLLHVRWRSKNSNGASTSEPTPLTSRSYFSEREVDLRVVRYTRCKFFINL